MSGVDGWVVLVVARVGTHLEAQVTTAFSFLSSINALPRGKGHTNKVSY